MIMNTRDKEITDQPSLNQIQPATYTCLITFLFPQFPWMKKAQVMTQLQKIREQQ